MAADKTLNALKRENKQLQRAVEELSILNELAAAIGASHDLKQIMQTIIRRSLRAVNAEQGVITPIDPNEQTALETLVRTTADEDEQNPFRPNASLLGWMQIFKKPLLLNRPREDDRFRGTTWDPAIRTVLCVPLVIQGNLTGVLTLYNKKSKRGFGKADERLLSIIAAQSAQVIENARLYEEQEELRRMQAALKLAYEIQTNLLPKQAPTIDGYDIAGVSIPAQTVGGDYYDFIPMADEKWALCVGDVSGKGLPAALTMATVQATLHNQVMSGESTPVCIARSNQFLCAHSHRKVFVTLFYGVLDAFNHTFEYVNAGHNRPILVRGGEGPLELEGGGLVLGFHAGQSYAAHKHTFAVGDVLAIFSDGITEAMNKARVQFSEERLSTLLADHATQPAAVIVDKLVSAVHAHTAPMSQFDDMTVLIIRRLEESSE